VLNYQELAQEVLQGKSINQEEALRLISTPDSDIFKLLSASDQIRRHYKKKRVRLCAIINAKSGRCSENCAFCAQSAHFKTQIETYPLVAKEVMFAAAKRAEKEMSATCFSIVTSGKSVHTSSDLENIASAIENIRKETKLNRCASLGILNENQIKKLKAAGLIRLHHNLETAESFFAKICTTHSYQERVQTVRLAKKMGLEVCSGGIFGLGETKEQRVELAFTLRELKVDSVPINILHPIPGTPAAEKYQPLPPFEVLKLVATYRFILPQADLGVLGGREFALRDLQALIFPAGANVILIGDYLVTKGQAPEKDLQMIKDLGLEVEK